MSSDNTGQTLAQDIKEIRQIISNFESLIQRFGLKMVEINAQMAEINEQYAALLHEGDDLLRHAKTRLHDIHEEAQRCGIEPLPEVNIPDEKLKAVWLALYQYHDGATADEVAENLNKHRTTVSSSLNSLSQWGFATKERRGHEIYYRAILKND